MCVTGALSDQSEKPIITTMAMYLMELALFFPSSFQIDCWLLAIRDSALEITGS